jgi:hypothetical protein
MALTRKEVVELIARAVAYGAWGNDKDTKQGGQAYEDEKWENFIDTAELTITVLETNGILCLVEGEAKEGDLVMKVGSDFENFMGDGVIYGLKEKVEFKCPKRIIQRNSIPAYHCKKETERAE